MKFRDYTAEIMGVLLIILALFGDAISVWLT